MYAYDRLISRINSDLNLITKSLSGLNDVTEDLENIMMCLGTVLYVHTSAVCAKIKLNFYMQIFITLLAPALFILAVMIINFSWSE